MSDAQAVKDEKPVKKARKSTVKKAVEKKASGSKKETVKKPAKRGPKSGEPKAKSTVTPAERKADKAMFRKFVLDKRRLAPLSEEEINQVIENCNSVLKRKKKESLKKLIKDRESIDRRIAELQK